MLDVPEDLPVEDIRHAMYKFDSVVEVVRLHIYSSPSLGGTGSASAAVGGGIGGGDKGVEGEQQQQQLTSSQTQMATLRRAAIRSKVQTQLANPTTHTHTCTPYTIYTTIESFSSCSSSTPAGSSSTTKSVLGSIVADAIEKSERPERRELPPAVIRITLASMDEYNILLQNGLNFYDATFFPTEANISLKGAKIDYKRR